MNFFNYCFNKASQILIKKSLQGQLKSQLRNLGLWDLEVNNQGHIAVDGIDTLDLLDQYGSPLLVVNKKMLASDIQQTKSAFSNAPAGSKILYSYKTNCIPGILSEIHNLGVGAEVISPYELWLAEQLQVPGELIVYNGVNKTDESIRRAIRLNILSINIDCEEEVDRIYSIAKDMNKKASVGVRLGLVSKSQFGLDVESGEALRVCKQINSLADYLDFKSIHFNITSNAKCASGHKYYVHKALEFICELKQKTGTDISYLNIGGGFGVQTTKNMSHKEYSMYRLFGCLPSPPLLEDCQSFNSFFNEILTCIKETCSRQNIEMPKILIEPGRLITSKSEFLLTRVNAIKRKSDGTQFAITETGRLSLTFPCDFEYHEVFVADRPNNKMTHRYHVMGRICTSADWMFKNRYLPKLHSGDVLVIMDAGAYFSSYSTTFAFPRPAIVLVSNGKSHVIRKLETFEYLTALDVDPRLQK